MKYNCAIFDLDGTLVDTLEDLKNSVNFALSSNGLPERTSEEVRSFVGNGIRLLIERSVPADTPASVTGACFTAFKEHYGEHSAVFTKPYDGILELLHSLKNSGIKLAVVSNKADFAVKIIVENYFPQLFDCAIGEREGIRRKPYPDTVLSVTEELNADIKGVIYIGDSEVDVETAHNCGIPCIAVTWGFRDRALLEGLGPMYIADTPCEIMNILSD